MSEPSRPVPPFPALNRLLDRHDFSLAVALAIVSVVQLFLFDFLALRPGWFFLYSVGVGLVSISYLFVLLHTILRIAVGHRRVHVRDIVFFLVAYGVVMVQFALYYGCLYHYLMPYFGPIFASSSKLGIVDFLYYSGVVMTSLGFGDIVPAHAAMKLCTVAECFIGQAFMVLGIGAVLGGLYGARFVERKPDR